MKKHKFYILISYLLIFIYGLIADKILVFCGINIIILLILSFSKFKFTQSLINAITFFSVSLWLLLFIHNINTSSVAWFSSLINLIWLLTSLKILEIFNNFKSKNIIIFLILSIGSLVLITESLLSNIICITSLFLAILSLLNLNENSVRISGEQFLIILLCIPITITSFFFIPKLNPWLSLDNQNIAKSGLSENLNPGDISSLVMSESLFARVYFNGNIPKHSERYWRVIVLDKFDGITWSKSDFAILNKKINQENHKNIISEKWITEPSEIIQRPWSGEGYPAEDNFISVNGMLNNINNKKFREEYYIYSGYEQPNWRLIKPSVNETYLNKNRNQRLNKIGEELAQKYSDPEIILKETLVWFLKANLTYTLDPGKMNPRNPYDDFLFNKKAGFCEHFAGSFSAMMRAANIPSRVVLGYQGGEEIIDSNKQSYLLIDNKYAHAWSEVWLPNKGWIRVDPTALVAPQRIESTSLVESKTFKLFSKNIFLNFNKSWRNIESKWQNNFLNIDNSFRNRLIPRFFRNNKYTKSIFILFVLSLIFIISAFYYFIRNISSDLIYSWLIKFYINKLKILKIKIDSQDTFNSISERVKNEYLQVNDDVDKLKISYNCIKFSCNRISFISNIKLFFYTLYLVNKILKEISKIKGIKD